MNDNFDPGLYHIPPQNLQAEESILATLLLYNEELYKIDTLKPDDFYRTAHVKIFSAILELNDAGEALDLVTVAELLKQKGQLEEVGGGTYLSTLTDTIPIAPNIEEYAKIVKDKAILRSLINLSNDTATKCFKGFDPAEDIINQASTALVGISDGASNLSYCFISDSLEEAIDEIEERTHNKNLISGLATGLTNLDLLTSGFQNSDLIIIAGRPSMGKTSLAVNMMQYFSASKICGVYYSLEMSKKQNTIRMLSSESNTNSMRIRSGHLSQDEWNKLTDAAADMASWPLIIDDSSSLHYRTIINRSHKLKKKYGIKYIVIDYLQLVRADDKAGKNRDRELGDITGGLKALAKDLDLPVIVLCQLNRKVEERSVRHPRLSDLRDSGNIEQDADVVMGLYRDEYYNPDENNPNRGKADIFLLKARNGPVGRVQVAFHGETSTFRNLADEYGDGYDHY